MASAAIQSNLSVGQVNPAPQQAPGTLYMPPNLSPQQVINQSIAAATGAPIIEFLAERPKYFFQIDVADYTRLTAGGNLFQVGQTQTTATYVLPLPMSLVDIKSVTYDTVQLGMVTGGLLNGAKNIYDGATSDNPQSVASGISSMTASGAVAVGAALLGKTALGKAASTIGTNAAGLAGYTPNAFLTILLKGPQYKRHTFRWKVSPRSEDEAMALQKIIMDLNNASSPGTAFGGSLFTFPSIFRCSFLPNSKYLFKMKPAVLENIAINYAGGGFPAFLRAMSDGLNAPAVVEFEMNFLELEFWLNGDFNADNDPTSVGDHSSLNGTGILSYLTTPSGGNAGNIIQDGQVPGG